MQLVGPEIESGPLAMKVQSPNYWAGREFPSLAVFLFVCLLFAGMWNLTKRNSFKWDNQGSFPKNMSFEPKKKNKKREQACVCLGKAFQAGTSRARVLRHRGSGFWEREVSFPEQGSGVSSKLWGQRSSKWPGHGTTLAFTRKEMGSYWRAKK